ncbi:MAG: ABC transporter permease subunit [Actinomycetota bacterium]|nr:ABC transporter permease subunit [Actinomycetota bacterium]
MIGALFALPFVALVVQAFADIWRAPALLPQEFGLRAWDAVVRSSGAIEALINSVVVAVVVTGMALALAWPAARVLGERRLRHPGPVFVLLAMPILVPPFAIGAGLTQWFIRLGLTDTLIGLVLAHLTVVLPYAVLVLLSGFGPAVRELEDMARASGLSPRQRLMWVTLPALRPALAVSAFLCFLVSWSQYGLSLAVGAGRATLPIVLLPFVRSDPQIAALLSLLFIAPALAALFVTVRVGRSPL